jgi:hypothetical protein
MRNPSASRRLPWRVLCVLAAAVVVPACGGGSSSPFVNPYVAPQAAVLAGPAALNFGTNWEALQSAVATPSGDGFYAAGYLGGATSGAARVVVVVKILNNGTLDNAFDGDGVAVTTLSTTGTNDEIDIALQSTGNILVSTTVPVIASGTRDYGVVRLLPSGALDTGFATAPVGNGIRMIDLSGTTLPTAQLTASDVCRSIAVDPDTDEIYLHGTVAATGTSPGSGANREDTDFAIIKLTANGDRDTTFANNVGHFQLDLNETGATPRGIRVLKPTGGAVVQPKCILASGYASAFGGPQPVIYKLDTQGRRYPVNAPAAPNADIPLYTFAGNGVFTGTPLELQTEVYNFAVHGDTIVTGGYGRESGTRNDWVSLRLIWNTPTTTGPRAGSRDMTWGGSPRGTSMINPSPDAAVGSNCRNAIALPGGKTLLLGSTGSATSPVNSQEAVWAVLDASGYLDVDYGGAPQILKDPTFNDAFWGGAVNATHMIAVGTRSSSIGNDDSFVLLIPIQ